MNYGFIKKVKYLLPAWLLALGMAGCVKEQDMGITPGGSDGGTASDEVTITVSIPGTQTPSTRSIAGSGGEAVVDKIDILVFKDTGTGEVLVEHAEGQNITNAVNTGVDENKTGHYTVQFRAKLTANPDAKTVVIVANAADEVAAVVNNGGPLAAYDTPKADILAALTYALANDPTDGYKWNANAGNAANPKPENGNYTPIPMYGEYDVTKGGTNNAGLTAGMKMDDILLTRMLARIDVKNTDADFVLQDVYLVNYNTAGYIAPAWNTATGAILKPSDSGYPYDRNTDPVLPASPGTQTREASAMHYDYTKYPAGITGEIYTYEAVATTGAENTAGHTDAVCLIVYGTYQGTGYYYRMDFTAGTDAGGKAPGETGFDPTTVKYMPVYRNHRYSFGIERVGGPGYDSFDAALASLGIRNNMKATLMVVDESGVLDYAFDGNHYLGTSGTVELEYAANSTATATVTTNYYGGWQVESVEYTGTDTGWLTATKTGSPGDRKSEILLTAMTMAGTDDREALVHLKAGNLRHTLTVTGDYFTTLQNTFNVTASNTTYTYAGGTWDYIVESYADGTLKRGTSISIDMPWVGEFSTDGTTWTDTPPAWFVGMAAGGAGGAATANKAQVKAFLATTTNAEHLILQNRASSPRGTATTPYDLSTKGAPLNSTNRNTANCYIIGYPGYYQLPLVYGNAIKGGNDNWQSYRPTQGATPTTFLTPFLRHDDQAIQKPYIYENTFSDGGPDNATLIWEDWPDLVTSVTLSADKKNLIFEVPADNIAQGNAILAVRNKDNEIMWSWHIWVTPLVDMDDPGSDLDATVNLTPVTYNFMKYNLGFCTAQSATFGTGPREIFIRFSQTGTTNTQNFRLKENNGAITTADNNPYWQWGRKDPFPGIAQSNKDKTIYGNYSYETQPAGVTLGVGVSHPNTFYRKTFSNWTNAIHYNLWSANNTVLTGNDNSVVKTVYDPSPVGFKMPASNAWTRFTSDGTSTGTINGIWKGDGYDFYLNAGKNTTAFYPATGYRDVSTGNAGNIGTSAYYWAATPNGFEGNYGYTLYLSNGRVGPGNGNYRAYGFSVRCVAE